jgi:hypothetical protein
VRVGSPTGPIQAAGHHRPGHTPPPPGCRRRGRRRQSRRCGGRHGHDRRCGCHHLLRLRSRGRTARGSPVAAAVLPVTLSTLDERLLVGTDSSDLSALAGARGGRSAPSCECKTKGSDSCLSRTGRLEERLPTSRWRNPASSSSRARRALWRRPASPPPRSLTPPRRAPAPSRRAPHLL